MTEVGEASDGPLPAARPLRVVPGLWRGIARDLEQRRLFILFPFALIAGLALALAFTPDPALLLGVGMLLLALLPLLRRSLPALRLLSLAVALWAGLGLLPLHGALFGTRMLARPAYGTFEMRIDRILSEAADGRRVIVSDIVPGAGTRPVPMRKARIIVRDPLPLEPGDRVRGPVRFYPVPGPVVPNGFDTQFQAYFDGIGAYGNATGALVSIATGQDALSERLVAAIRHGIAERVDAVLQQPAAGVARALINGDQSAVPAATRDTMALAGLAHVLSVSGLHLTIVAGGVFFILRLALAALPGGMAWLPAKPVAAIVAMLAAFLYFSISGGDVAALRSTIMIVLVFGAVVFGRRALTMRNVAIAGLLVIVGDPASAFRPSFQLSFAAVVGLIGMWEMWPPRGGRAAPALSRVAGHFIGIGATSLVAGLATLLFSVYHFQQTSPLGILGNLLALPLVGFVMMPAGALAALAMPLGWEAPFLVVMGWSIDRMLDLGGLVAAWSQGLNASPLLTPLALVLGLAGFAWFAFVSSSLRLLGPLLVLPAVLLFALDRPPDLLIADTTQAVAMRGAGGLELVAGQPGSFAVNVWRESYDEPIIAPSSLLRCDKLGCFGASPLGFSVALVRDVAGFYEDCALADLVITRRRAPATCAAPTIIDADSLSRFGTHWLRWDAAARRFEIRTAIPDLDRPWRAPH